MKQPSTKGNIILNKELVKFMMNIGLKYSQTILISKIL